MSAIAIWIVGVLAAVICVFWIIKQMGPQHISMEEIQADLETLQIKLSNACNGAKYYTTYNPHLGKGTLFINDTTICMNATKIGKCTSLLCSLQVHQKINLDNVTLLHIRKENGKYNITYE